MSEMLTEKEVEDWRTKIKKKIWHEFAVEPNEAHGKFLMKEFDKLCDAALFGISIDRQSSEMLSAEQVERDRLHSQDLQPVINEYLRQFATLLRQTTEGTDALITAYLESTENKILFIPKFVDLCRTYEQRLKVVEAETVGRCESVLKKIIAERRATASRGDEAAAYEADWLDVCLPAIRALSPKMAHTEKTMGAKDWFEDFDHENGKYVCVCSHCGCEFLGHKRRVCCKKCSIPDRRIRSERRVGTRMGLIFRVGNNDERSGTDRRQS